MLGIDFIRENKEIVKEKLSLKGVEVSLVDSFLEVDDKWKSLVAKRDEARTKQKELGVDNRTEARNIKMEIKALEEEIRKLKEEREIILLQLPNLPDDEVIVGKSEEDNVVIREEGEKRDFDFEVRDYITLGESLNLVNTSKAAEAAGARFGYLLNEAVLLEFALVKLVMNLAVENGFKPVIPPVMARPEVMTGMGKHRFVADDDAFYIERDNLYLVGSAEHTMGPMYMNEIVKEKDLPSRWVGFSTAFRRESGSYGKDTRGILRVHQFDKVEMFSFTTKEKSKEEHKLLLSLQEEILQMLELPYRVVDICTGDMGWPDKRQFDIETWMPGQGVYRETHSCSNTGDYQARGINARVKRQDGSLEYMHMLNATGVAVGRMLIAIMENYQEKDGSVLIPKVLRDYVGKEKIEK